MSYNKIIKYFFIITIIGIIIISLVQANKPVTIKTPYLYLSQEQDSSHDNIIRTSDGGASTQTVFSGRNVQGFRVNGDKMLVSEGNRFQTTKLRLVDLNNSSIKEIDFADKYIDTIYKIKNDFIFIFEGIYEVVRDYKASIGIYRTATDKIEIINPQSFASEVSQLHVNPSGTLAVFNGLNSYRYLLDLDNFENIKKLENNYPYTAGFVDDSQLIIGDYFSSEFRVLNVTDNTEQNFPIEGKNFQEIVGKNNTYFYTFKDHIKDTTIAQIRRIGSQLPSASNLSYEKPTYDQDGEFVAVAAYNKEENKTIQDLNQREFVTPTIYLINVKKNTITETTLRSKKFLF